jgi:ferritin-like protein
MGSTNRKPLIETDKPNGKIKQYWNSAREAGEFYNINVVNISMNVTGNTKQAKGHFFRYATKEEIEQYSKIVDYTYTQTSVEPTPIDDNNDISLSPAPILPESIQFDEIQPDALSPFARLLEEGKKKIKNNPK